MAQVKKPKTRLNQAHRDKIIYFAQHKLAQVVEAEIGWDAAAAAFDKELRAVIKKEYPARDMNVLKRYSVGTLAHSVNVSLNGSGRDYFTYGLDKGPVYIPRGVTVSMDSPAAVKFFSLRKEREKLIATKMADFRAVIRAAVTFEDLLEVFPAVEQLAEQITGRVTAVSLLTPELKNRVLAESMKMKALKKPAGK